MAVSAEDLEGKGQIILCVMLLQKIFTLDCDNLI